MCGGRRKIVRRLVTASVILTLLLSGYAVAGDEEPVKENFPTYIIGAGDVLNIMTWKEPDFSLEGVMVRRDGKLTVPLINDVMAAGLTTIELKTILEQKLLQYLDTPFVTVAVVEPVSQKFYILGEVTNTGEYPLVKNLTVMQAFAVAGGFTEWASKKEIILCRKEGDREKIIKINYKNILKGDFSNNISLKADDTIIVP